jgi:hypothetical protein
MSRTVLSVIAGAALVLLLAALMLSNARAQQERLLARAQATHDRNRLVAILAATERIYMHTGVLCPSLDSFEKSAFYPFSVSCRTARGDYTIPGYHGVLDMRVGYVEGVTTGTATLVVDGIPSVQVTRTWASSTPHEIATRRLAFVAQGTKGVLQSVEALRERPREHRRSVSGFSRTHLV